MIILSAFTTTIFLSALLLFQVQPIIARYILPWFGGTPAVWTTAMLFFQMMLLAGYLYTHLIVSRLSVRRQVLLHMFMLVFSLVFLPITPADYWKPKGDGAPLVQIAILLFVTVGMPYIMVSSTAPLIQSWFAKAHPKKSPYRLYALSNTGSFLGLLSYPFLIEPLFGLNNQTLLWSAAYGLFVLVSLWTSITVWQSAKNEIEYKIPNREERPSSRFDRILWLLLSATGVVVLLAATNQLCKDVAVIPLLWILPLTLYLLSFIVTFGRPEWYYRPFWAVMLMLSITAVVYLLHQEYADVEVGLYIQIFIYSAVVFGCCMVCHGELYRLRPNTKYLTSFYLYISLGGAIGGMFVNLLAPLIFLGYWEFHVSLVATILLLGVCVATDRYIRNHPFLQLVLWSGWAVVLLTTVFFLASHIKGQQEESIATHRSFYGILRVYEYDVGTKDHLRSLYHGRIGHGDQLLDPKFKTLPITYYGSKSGIGVAFQAQRDFLSQQRSHQDMQIGVVGLGTATIAAYTNDVDNLRFYEINPDVTDIARRYFSYLSDAKSTIKVVPGDARLSMERELRNGQINQFDLLAIDAFSGDAIPIHLLTREALALYRRHLTSDGLLAIHISNLHFDLRPVVRALATDAGMRSIWISDNGDGQGEDPNDWVLLTNNKSVYDAVQAQAELWPEDNMRELLWTDDFEIGRAHV